MKSEFHVISPSKRARGVTLIEVLVVMGICGVLALILIPMALHAREGARTVVCMDNLKALGQCYAVSLTDSSGVLSDAYYEFNQVGNSYTVALRSAHGIPAELLLRGDMNSALTCPSDAMPARVLAMGASGLPTEVPTSYGYNVALPLLFRNASRVSAPVNTVTFYDGAAGQVIGNWQYSTGWAAASISNRHRGEANYLFMDGHVETDGAFPDLAFDGGAMRWATTDQAPTTASTTTTTRPPATTTTTAPLPTSTTTTTLPVQFVITDGSVRPAERCTASILCVGAALQYGAGGPRIPVQAHHKLNNSNKVRITSDVHGGETVTFNNLPANTKINIVGKVTQYVSAEYASNDRSGHAWVLRNGDVVPSIAGFDGQRSLLQYLANYINPSGHVTLAANQAIYLFEMSDQIDYNRYSWADFQDLVVLVTLNH